MKKYLFIIVFAIISILIYLFLTRFSPETKPLFFHAMLGGFIGWNLYRK